MTRINLGWYGFLVALALLPTALPGVFTNGFDVHVMILVLLYASMAQAWNLIGGYGGQVSFGHSVFFGLGAYGAAMALVTYHGSPWVGALVGSLVAAGAAVIISYPCFRLKGHYFAIATFAIVEIFNRLFMMWNWVGGALGLDYPLLEEGWKNFMWFDTKVPYYYGALGLFAVVFGVVRWVDGHRLGAWLRAVREGQEAAESLGVNSARVKLSALALSAFLAGLCGAFFAQYNYRVDPPMVMSLDMAMKFVLISILGGVGTFWGPLVGAAILMPLQEYTRAAWGGVGGGVDLIIFGVLIIFVVTRQPQGVVGFIGHVFRRKG
ncbi:MAG TPA: branched-chain amino acid ABC transporter permease [Synergistaceae bacterium]|nr:branched-chain amino acid ABC transporter permease [Synergistaceae bacterium]HQK24344.1 branched-chain amino acid ABC transporter permease [Synergistaceae bacterium]